jgi:outer membrane lipoprotein-sorting protein
MNKFLRLGLSAMALMFLFNTFSVKEVKAQGVLNEILSRMDQQYKTLSSFKSNIRMVKYNPQLDETDTLSGTTMYLPKQGKRDMYIRIDWKEPLEESIAIIGKEYTLYRKRLDQVVKGKTDSTKTNASAGGALDFMGMSKAQLKEKYTVKYLGQESVSGGIQTWHLELTPKIAMSYKLAELWVDGNGMPIQAKIIGKNDDSTTVLLSSLQKNVTLNAKVFVIDYPKSAKVVKS